jgi:lysine-specific demethylase 8
MRIVGSVERIDKPSREDFRACMEADRPVVVTGVATEWPAFGLWSLDHLRKTYGEVPIDVVTPPPDHAAGLFDWRETTYRKTTLGDYIDNFEQPGAPREYLAAVPISEIAAGLADDFSGPDFAGPGEAWDPLLFFGAAGSKTALHYDGPYNLHALLVGRKRFLLIDRKQLRNLYPDPLWKPSINYSRVDVDAPDFARWPRSEDVPAYEVDLAPGEMLFVPSFWWHRVHTIETSLGLAFWFGRRKLCWSNLRRYPSYGAEYAAKAVRGAARLVGARA